MKKILLADDEKPYLLAIEDILKNEGFNVIAVDNGNQVFDIIESRMPDCIIVDATLSGISGFDISRKIKEHPVYYKIPVILMIPKDEEYNLTNAITSMGNDSLTKPITRVELLNKINKQIEIAEENEKNKNLKEKYFQLLECVGRSVIILDHELNILGTNSEFMSLVGIDSNVNGMNLKKVYPEGYSVISELVEKGQGKISLKKSEMSLAPMGDDYILFIDFHDKEKEAIERVLIEFNTWSKLYKSIDIESLTGNFLNIIEKFITVGEIYIARVLRGKLFFTSLDNPNTILYSIEADHTSIKKINDEGIGFAGNINTGTFKDWDFLMENGYHSVLLHPITLLNKRRVICFVHEKEDVYSSPVKDFSVLVQEFFLLYMYMMQMKENRKGGGVSDTNSLQNIVDNLPQSFVYVKNGEVDLISGRIKTLTGDNDLKEWLNSEGMNNEQTQGVIFSIFNAKSKSHVIWETAGSGKIKVSFIPFGENDILTVFEDISEIDKLKKLIAFKNRLQSIVSVNEELNNIFHELSLLIKKYIPCDYSAFIIFHEESSLLDVKYTDLEGDLYRPSMPVKITGSIFEKLLMTKDLIVNQELEKTKICDNDNKFRELGINSYIAAPLLIKEKLYGTIELFSNNKNAYNKEHQNLINTLAVYASRSVMDNLVMHNLENSAKMYEIIKERSKEVFLTVTNHGHIINSNHSILNLLGYTPDEIKKKHLKDIVSPGTKFEFMLEHSGDYDFENKKGGIKSISVSPSKLTDDKYLLILHRI